MPVVEIQALVSSAPRVPELLEATARNVAEALGTDVKKVWVTFRPIEPGSYFEGGAVRGVADAAAVSPLVLVRAFEGRSKAQKAACLRAVARAVGLGLGTDPENVFAEYREIASGHVFTGGDVR